MVRRAHKIGVIVRKDITGILRRPLIRFNAFLDRSETTSIYTALVTRHTNTVKYDLVGDFILR